VALASDDSGNLVFTEYDNNEHVELKSINLRNGKRELLENLYAGLPKKIFLARYSVDSKKLFLLNIEAGKPTLFSLDLNTKKLQKINDSFEDIKSFSINNEQLLVSGTYKSTQGLWSISSNIEPTLVLRASGDEQILSAVVDSKTGALYYQNFQTNIDVALIANNNINDLTELNSNGNEGNGIFSEDGKSIYFVSNRSGYSEVWCYSVDSNQSTQITDLKALSIIGPIISMDGKRMAVEYRADKIYLGIISLENHKLIVSKSVPAYRFPLAWSHDDKYIYASEHEAQINLFRYDTEKLDVSIVQKKAGLFAQESADGKKLKFIDYERDGLIERDLTSGEETVLSNSIQGLTQLAPGQLRLNAEKTGILAIANNGTQRQLNYYPFANKTTLYQKIMDLPEQSWVTHISDHGDKILLLQSKPPSGDIMKIEFRK
jgi:Tol biopolymer transport system component